MKLKWKGRSVKETNEKGENCEITGRMKTATKKEGIKKERKMEKNERERKTDERKNKERKRNRKEWKEKKTQWKKYELNSKI